MSILSISLLILAICLLILGVVGLIHPALPGLPIMFGATWLIAYIGNYQFIGTWTLAILAIITLFGMAMDFIAGLLGAKFTGASKEALWGAFIGGVVGIFFALFGMIFGPLIGAAIGELIAKKDIWLAGKVGLGTFIGFIVGVVAKVGCALVILLILLGNHLIYGIGALL